MSSPEAILESTANTEDDDHGRITFIVGYVMGAIGTVAAYGQPEFLDMIPGALFALVAVFAFYVFAQKFVYEPLYPDGLEKP